MALMLGFRLVVLSFLFQFVPFYQSTLFFSRRCYRLLCFYRCFVVLSINSSCQSIRLEVLPICDLVVMRLFASWCSSFACYRLNMLLSFLPLIQPSSLLVVLVSLASVLLLLLSSSVSIHSCDGLLVLTYLDTRGFSIRVGCSTKRTQCLCCDHFFRTRECCSVSSIATAIRCRCFYRLDSPNSYPVRLCYCLLSYRLVFVSYFAISVIEPLNSNWLK